MQKSSSIVTKLGGMFGIETTWTLEKIESDDRCPGRVNSSRCHNVLMQTSLTETMSSWTFKLWYYVHNIHILHVLKGNAQMS